MVRVSRVHPDSIAAELGIEPGTELRSVNGREIVDFLDWEFLTADDDLVIEALLPNGEDVVFDVERPEGETMGVDLEPPTIRRCANRCEFCFIEGLPKGMRKPLYIRDDDYRLSFAYGNFATLSNLKARDVRRLGRTRNERACQRVGVRLGRAVFAGRSRAAGHRVLWRSAAGRKWRGIRFGLALARASARTRAAVARSAAHRCRHRHIDGAAHARSARRDFLDHRRRVRADSNRKLVVRAHDDDGWTSRGCRHPSGT